MRHAIAPPAAAIALLASLACGAISGETTVTPPATASQALPSIPAATLVDMQSTVTALNAGDVAAQAIRPADMEAVLAGARFAGGVQRTFGGGTGAFSRVVARALAFETDQGAATYLEWLRQHASEVLGLTEVVQTRDLPPGAVSVRHLPDGCCPKEVPVYLVAWRRDALVLSVEAGGRRARARPIVPIVRAFDQQV